MDDKTDKPTIFDRITNGVDFVDNKILDGQEAFFKRYEIFFTFNKALFVGLIVGAALSFIGGDCHGMLSIESPFVILFGVIVLFAILDIFKYIDLSIGRLFRLSAMGVAGYLLALEGYGIYSLQFMEYTDACKPYAFSNDIKGYVLVIVPIVLLVLICFRGGEK